MELLWEFERKVKSAPNEELPDGPWMREADKAQWIDPATGYDCLIVRNHFGALCGYVGVPPEHPCYGKGYDEISGNWDDDAGGYVNEIADIHVHGGLTFAGLCDPGEPVQGICHLAEYGATPKPWWLGFDCAHSGDLHPGDLWTQARLGETWAWRSGDTYKDFRYVMAEIADLAGQLKAVEVPVGA